MRRTARAVRYGGPFVLLILTSDRGLAQHAAGPVTVGSHVRYRRLGSDTVLIPGRVRSIGNDSMFVALDADTSERMPILMLVGGAAIGAFLGYAIAPPPHWDVVAFPTRTSNNDGSPGLGMNVGVRYWFASRGRSR